MNIVPKTKAAWGRIVLLPFQVYTVTAWMAAQAYLELAVGRRPDTSFVAVVVGGYVLCFLILLIGGIHQRISGDRAGSTVSLLAAAISAIACWFLLPTLAQP